MKHKEPGLLLAQKWVPDHTNPEGYWISEKFDGVRAYYDPQLKIFISRTGTDFECPVGFCEGFPTDHSLDGELYMGRKKLAETMLVLKSPTTSDWSKMTFVVFDTPSLQVPFEKRQEWIQEYFKLHSGTNARLVENQICTGRDHVYELLKHYESLGGMK